MVLKEQVLRNYQQVLRNYLEYELFNMDHNIGFMKEALQGACFWRTSNRGCSR
jgi:hypothetical protein